MSRKRRRVSREIVTTSVDKLSHEGRGIAYINGKITFIAGALPGEEVSFRYQQKRARMDEGNCVDVIKASPLRVQALCKHFGECGGCSLQHLSHQEQVRHKQHVLQEMLERVGKISLPESIPPLTGPQWAYRRKARFGVRYERKARRLEMGFRQSANNKLTDIECCDVLHSSIGQKLQTLKVVIEQLSIRDDIPQIEIAVADNKTALVIRHMRDFNDDDIHRLKAYEQQSQFKLFLQAAGPDSIIELSSDWHDDLVYELPEYNITLSFAPTDFTQINFDINRQMIHQAIALLELNDDDHVLDLFCGLGNFTLPMARHCAKVIGIEVNDALIERAKSNAKRNNIMNVEWRVKDLSEVSKKDPVITSNINKILLDPSRTGADVILREMKLDKVERIVYVSCNPATLARDTEILVHEKGFQCVKAGILDMFPHTSHVESMALFIHTKALN